MGGGEERRPCLGSLCSYSCVLGWCCYAAVLVCAMVCAMVCQWGVLCLFLRSDAVCHDSYSTQLPCAATQDCSLRTQAVPISSTVPATSYGEAACNSRCNARKQENETQTSLRATKPTKNQPLRVARAQLPEQPLRRCQRQAKASRLTSCCPFPKQPMCQWRKVPPWSGLFRTNVVAKV